MVSNRSNSSRNGTSSPYGLYNTFTSAADSDMGCTRAAQLVLDDADPAGLLTVAGTQPDVVTLRKADLDRKVWS